MDIKNRAFFREAVPNYTTSCFLCEKNNNSRVVLIYVSNSIKLLSITPRFQAVEYEDIISLPKKINK